MIVLLVTQVPSSRNQLRKSNTMTTGYPRKACAICCNSTRRSETCGALHPSISLLPSWSLFVFVAILLFVEGQQTTPNSALPVDWAAPWQPTSAGGGGVDRLNYQGLPPTVFAPGGRLYSVERVVQAASALEDESSNLVVAISCQNGLVVVSTLRQSPHLSVQPILSDSSENKQRSKILPKDDPTKQPLWVFDEQDQSPFVIHSPFLSLSTLSSSTSDCPLMAVCAGNAVDSQLLQRKIQRLADRALWDSIHSSHSVTHDNLPFTECQVLARQLADHLQVPTQTVGGRSGRILAVRETKSNLNVSLTLRSYVHCLFHVTTIERRLDVWWCQFRLGSIAIVASGPNWSVLVLSCGNDWTRFRGSRTNPAGVVKIEK